MLQKMIDDALRGHELTAPLINYDNDESTGGHGYLSDDEDGNPIIRRSVAVQRPSRSVSFREANKVESGTLLYQVRPCLVLQFVEKGVWKEVQAKQLISLRFVEQHDGIIMVQHFSEGMKQVLRCGLLIWVDDQGNVERNQEKLGKAAHF